LDQLAGCVVKPAIEQYGKYLGRADVTLRDRQQALRVLAGAVVRSVEATADNPRHLVVFAGPSGSGKTRAGYEGSAMWDHAAGRAALEEALKGKPQEVADKLCGLSALDTASGANVLTLYIDLNNGLQYDPEIDLKSADVRLGARLAANALGWALGELVHVPQEQLLVAKVLSAILRGHLERRTSSAPPLLLVVHVDEWQLYMQKVVEKQKVDVSEVVGDIKSMFSALNSFAFNPPEDLRGMFVLLPILSGTPVLGGVQLSLTERMKRINGPLPPLSDGEALELAVELFGKAGFGEAAVRSMLASVAARVGLSDTGFMPRMLVQLCDAATCSARKKDPHTLRNIKWADCAWQLSAELREDAKRIPEAVVLLAMSGEAVEMTTVEGVPVTASTAAAVRRADEAGIVRLEEVGLQPGRFVVRLPFVLLRLRCTREFPEDLMRPLAADDRWTWDEFERLYAHFTAVRLNALLQLAGDRLAVMTLRDVIKGARGPDALLAQKVRLRGTRQVHWEEAQFMPRKSDQPEKVGRVRAAPAQDASSVEVDLRAGIFLAKAGNSLFDMRYTLEGATDAQAAVHVFVQDRHTGTDTTKVNTKEISDWYSEADNATKKWRAGTTDNVALLYFTNRKLTDPDALNEAFFRSRPRLLVVTSAELGDALTPAFVGRGVIPSNSRGG
jgi:hypothetical protein